LIGNAIVAFGNGIVCTETIILKQFNNINPIYNGICRIESIFKSIDIDIVTNKSNHKRPSGRKHSSGRHLCSFYARRRRHRHLHVIVSGSNQSKTDNHKKNEPKSVSHLVEEYNNNFHPIDDPSCQDTSWYDAISPYWSGGSIWDGVYVLNHQVVSVTTDPIFLSDLPPALEATIQTPEARSEGENVGPRATIALDSGSSIHIFKDAFLLTYIHSDNNRSIGVRTTDSKFRVNDIGHLCDDLNTLPLPSDGYYFYPKGVANILSLALIAETKRVFMDSAIDDAIYVFNEDGSYVRFSKTPNGMYCIDITTDDDDHIVMAYQTVKGESAHFSSIDCRRAAKVQDLQEALACPSDVDLANAIEHNVIGNNPFTRRDVRIAKKIFGPDVPAMKGKTVKRKSKMPSVEMNIGHPVSRSKFRTLVKVNLGRRMLR
jgi:hypothetical protein